MSGARTKPRPRSLARRLRQGARGLYRRVAPSFVVQKGDGWVSYRGTRTVLLRSGPATPRRGIYLQGACDVPSVFGVAPLVVDGLDGSLCIHSGGSNAADARSDLLLQARDGVASELTEDVRDRFDLPRAYFAPALFEPEFSVPGLPDPGPFPKTVVVLSMLPDLSRTMYRHREHGYLVDPGAGWLNRIAAARADVGLMDWFRTNFESVGRMTVEAFRGCYRSLIPSIRDATGAHVLVFNALEIEPLDPTHDFSVRNLESATRRRRFNLALAELSEELGFSVVDVDRVLKEQGVAHQVDFSHFPTDRMRAVAAETRRILGDLGVV